MTSVVIPVYNGADVLTWSVPSVCALAEVREIVYADDGSTDGTPRVLAELADARVRVVRLPQNAGRAAARNAGAAVTTGDTLLFLDADVRPPPDLAVRFAAALQSEGAVATVARVVPCLLGEDPYHEYLRRHPRGVPDVAPGTPVPWKTFVTTACAVSRAAFDAAGGFDESVGYGEDLALACALARTAPRGLVASGASVEMTDIGTLDSALAKVHEFGRSLPHLAAVCPTVYAVARLERLLSPSLLVRLAARPAIAALVRRALPRLPLDARVRAVRYLLGQSLLHAHADALRDARR